MPRRLLGRDRSRVYALLRSGDLVAAADKAAEDEGPRRIERSRLDRWLVAGGGRGGPLTPRNAWAVIGLASGDQASSDSCVGLLERAEEVSRTRARLAREGLATLAPGLRRRATLLVLNLPPALRDALDRDATLVRTGVSAAPAYGWADMPRGQPWLLDGYLPLQAVARLQEHLATLAGDPSGAPKGEPVLVRAVDEPWPFAPQFQLAPQPLAALDLLDYPDSSIRAIGRGVLLELAYTTPTALARRSARARATQGPLVGRLLRMQASRAPRPVVAGDPRTDTRAAAAHMVGLLWAAASQGLGARELRAAIGLSRERLEDAYQYLLEHPPLGLAVQRHREEFSLVTAPEVSASIERQHGNPRPVPLSRAAQEVLAIVAYRQPIARTGLDFVRGAASDSALDTLLQRGLVASNQHHLLVTTRAFLDYAALRDLADLPPLAEPADQERGGLVHVG